MQDSRKPTGKSFTAFSSAAEEAQTKRDKAEAKREEQEWDNEGGPMSSNAGRVIHWPGADLPYVAILTRDGRGCTERSFATMREAEAFIKRNTPVPGRTLSGLYDRDPGES
jgi:hypothetical protein